MLKRLEVQNYAIIESLHLDLKNGLTIITGETGAGKSILLGALGLIMGNRADSKVLYHEDQKCIVEAIYDIKDYDLRAFFEEHDLDYEEETIIRRVIGTNGKSRAFINDEPTTLGILKKLSDYLVDMHQQFDTLDIHEVSFQTQTLDALAKNDILLAKYRSLYTEYKKELKLLSALILQEKEAKAEMDFLNFQYQEFEEAQLIAGEQEEKEQELKRLSAAEDIKTIAHALYHSLVDDEINMVDLLQTHINELSSIAEADQQASEIYERLTTIREELRDIAAESLHLSESTDYNEEEITHLSERLSLIYKLEKKHSVTSLNGLLEVQEDIATKISGFTTLSTDIKSKEQKVGQLDEELRKLALELSSKRKAVVADFEKEIHRMLVTLSMEHAHIKVNISNKENLSPSGIDDINFLFAANKGSSFKELKEVASGGEISRLTLCIKALIADAITLPTLIFDEIDTGVSGEVAGKMGAILHQLADQHQVISITHSPQIASQADTHLFVYKEEKSDRTVTGIKSLNKKERIYEIAKMLSTDPPTQSAMANAKDLISH